MKLGLEEIRAIAVGTAYVEEKNGKIELHRFTKEQEEAYKVYSADFYKKCFATAGVRLEFITDSKELFLGVEVNSASSRKYFSHSVYVNGEFVGDLSAQTNKGSFKKSFSLGDGEKNVTVYFPWNVRSKIVELRIDDGATLSHIEKSLRMIQFGDSITHGYDAQEPAGSYASLVSDALDAYAINKGIGGEIFFPELATLPDEISPDIITVAYGTNDWTRGNLERFEKNSRAFYEGLTTIYPNAKIFALAPIWRSNYNKSDRMCDFSHIAEHFRVIAKDIPNLYVIDCFDFVPHDPSYFSPDCLHPNDEGFSYYAEGVLKAILEYNA